MGTYDPADYKVPEGHRWVSAVPEGDNVQGLGYVTGFGQNPTAENSTFIHLSGDATADKNYKEDAAPSDPLRAIGELILKTQYPPVLSPLEYQAFETELKPGSFPDFSNHNSYMEPETETLRDFARVVVGTKKQ